MSKQADAKTKKLDEELRGTFPASDPPILNSTVASPAADARRAEEASNRLDREERAIDETLRDSFPASDPPAWVSTHAGKPRKQ